MTASNQIPQDRLDIADAAGRLTDEHLDVLGAALACWAGRDDTKADPAARRAANTAMDQIDAMLRELHALRSRLVGEIRASDDATAARVDALLAERAGLDHFTAAPAEPWARTPDRDTWRAYRRGLVLTVTRVADGGGWTATAESPNTTERSPSPLPTRLAAQAWADSRAADV